MRTPTTPSSLVTGSASTFKVLRKALEHVSVQLHGATINSDNTGCLYMSAENAQRFLQLACQSGVAERFVHLCCRGYLCCY